MAPFDPNMQSKLLDISKSSHSASVEVTEHIKGELEKLYKEKEKEIGDTNIRRIERLVLLRTIDSLWMDHIDAMEYLRDSVRLRAYGQRDPLVEYKIEGQKMFEQLTTSIKTQVANTIFKVNVIHQPKEVKTEEKRTDIANTTSTSSNKQSASMPRQAESASKVGRNDPCPCGSGKKYKKCHGK
jgi:preprotein translocase subunit SecA